MKIHSIMLCGSISLIFAANGFATEKQKPYPHYWMSISTVSQNMPGMSPEIAGMASMFGGKNMFGPKRELHLQLESPLVITEEPKADHLIPPDVKMGDSLPLKTPKMEKSNKHEKHEIREQYEKPKARMLIYWGCGETIGKGQPRVLDTATMSMTNFGKAFAGRTPTHQTAPSSRKGWTYSEWPDLREKNEIPKDSSLVGVHKIEGNYLKLQNPLQFTIDNKRDFMAPVEFNPLEKTVNGALKTEWKPIPTAIGYFATAMGHNQDTGESIFWSASEVPEIGFGLQDYLTPADVHRFIKEKVLLPTSTTTCTIPPIFKSEQPGMMQFIAYGEEQNFVHPPKPKDTKKRWDIEWSAKVRLKSTSMLPLMVTDDDGSHGKSKKSRSNKKHPNSSNDDSDNSSDKDNSSSENDDNSTKGMGDVLRGMFGL